MIVAESGSAQDDEGGNQQSPDSGCAGLDERRLPSDGARQQDPEARPAPATEHGGYITLANPVCPGMKSSRVRIENDSRA